jgi:spore germination protein KB
MKKRRETISTLQLMFSVGCFIQGSSLLTFPSHSLVKQEAWITIIIGYLISLPVIWIYTALAGKYPGKSLVDINEIVLGKFFGRLFSALYIAFFISLAFLNTRIIGDFVNAYMLPLTPMPVVLAMFIFICCWAVRRGVNTITRYGTLFVIIIFIVILFTNLLLIKNIRLCHLLPIFSQPVPEYFKSAHTIAMLPICEIMAFIMLFPSLLDTSGAAKALWGGSAIGAATLLIAVARDTAVLGPVAQAVTAPSFLVIRMINVANILTRMEILYALALIMLMFFKVSILLYAAVFGVSQLLRLSSYKFLVSTFGVIVVLFAITTFESSIEHSDWINSGSAPVYSTFFQVGLPAVTVITAVIRSFFRKEEAKSS